MSFYVYHLFIYQNKTKYFKSMSETHPCFSCERNAKQQAKPVMSSVRLRPHVRKVLLPGHEQEGKKKSS